VHRWGGFAGRQRYRCCGCRRTFSDLTGTPAAYIKKIWLWSHYGDCMTAGTSVRAAASLLGINTATVFRWRHRLLGSLRARESVKLRGWIELDVTRFAYSEKGRRGMIPPGRRRGLAPGEKLLHRRVAVLVACDRHGHTIMAQCDGYRPSVRDLEHALAGRIGRRPTFIAEYGQFGPGSIYARHLNGVFHDARPGKAPRDDRSLVHIRTARACVIRLKDWILRFRGVATKYLRNYLIWHCIVDRTLQYGVAATFLHWPLPDPVG
jgi:hypothetical protein